MKAFVIKIAELFKMDSQLGNEFVFKEEKRRLLIPLYQREYKWSDERIASLINDIKKRDKFLGNIILDEKDNCYEIVDGQQRLTTCVLALLVLYNHYTGHPMEQGTIERLMCPYDEFVLKNDSIGDYVVKEEECYSLTITEDNDIYGQAADFSRAYEKLEGIIESFSSNEEVNEFRQKLINSKILVLINDEHEYTRPVEQIFLDINEKAQLLMVEDIFKGHCFENYDVYQHTYLRNKWVELKRVAAEFKKFAFEDTSQYIYLYLLETETVNMPKNLMIEGKHYLENKTTDQIELILNNLIGFGKAVVDFHQQLNRMDYRFVDLCNNSNEYRNTDDHLILKQMCKSMIEYNGAIYQKMPLLYLVFKLKNNTEIVDQINHKDFRKIITNLYIYMNLFVLSGARKSKKELDQTIRSAFDETAVIETIISAAKHLRVDKVQEFTIKQSYSFEKLSFIYSVIDSYVANDNWIKTIYSRENHHNLEHFIIPDNRNAKVRWEVDRDASFNITIPADIAKKWKKRTVNQLVIDSTLNEMLGNKDIVCKINMILDWYRNRNEQLPKHVELFVNHILSMPEYERLKEMKEIQADQSAVQNLYEIFLRAYFDEENSVLIASIERAFVDTFRNN